MTAGRPLSVARGAISDTQRAFYEAVFGWRLEGATLTLEGRPVANVGLGIGEPGWLTVLSSTALEADLDIVTHAGGRVVERGEATAVVRDTSGAALALHAGDGPGLSAMEGHFVSSQLNAHDLFRAAAFYAEVCGWKATDAVNGTFTYQDFSDAEGAVAGLMAIDEASGLGVPVMWQPYVHSTDVDGVAARVEEHGGRIWVRPTSIAPGRFAVCADPDGDVFAVELMV